MEPRRSYSEEKEDILNDFVRMGALTISAVDKALTAIDTGSRGLALDVMEGDAAINGLEVEIESACVRFLQRRQPLAKDMRQIVVILKMLTDVERIADSAADIAAICNELPPGLPPELSDIKRMAAAAREMVADAIQAHVSESMVLADYVVRRDDIVNGYFHSIKNEIAAWVRHRPNEADLGLDYLLILKYLERLGDHAANIAQWVRYYKTGFRTQPDQTL